MEYSDFPTSSNIDGHTELTFMQFSDLLSQFCVLYAMTKTAECAEPRTLLEWLDDFLDNVNVENFSPKENT